MTHKSEGTKTLYITDLDGTLLNSQGEVSYFTKKTINSLIRKGMYFSFSTARGGPSAIKIMSEVKIDLPVVFIQGAAIYDIKKQIYLNVETIDAIYLEEALYILKRHDIQCFLFGLKNNKLVLFYEDISSSYLKAIYDHWTNSNNIPFIKVDNLNKIFDCNIMYLLSKDIISKIKPVFEEIIEITGLTTAFFGGSNSNGIYNMECLKSGVSKYKSVLYLKKQFGFQKVIGFGDTSNDIPLFEACDEFYVPNNADDKIKSIATGIIDSNDDDGVAKFLARHFAKNK